MVAIFCAIIWMFIWKWTLRKEPDAGVGENDCSESFPENKRGGAVFGWREWYITNISLKLL